MSVVGKVRGDREQLSQSWREIKHSKLGHDKLDLFIRQAKIKLKNQTTRSKETLEGEVRKILTAPLFKGETSSNEVLSKLLTLTEM